MIVTIASCTWGCGTGAVWLYGYVIIHSWTSGYHGVPHNSKAAGVSRHHQRPVHQLGRSALPLQSWLTAYSLIDIIGHSLVQVIRDTVAHAMRSFTYTSCMSRTTRFLTALGAAPDWRLLAILPQASVRLHQAQLALAEFLQAPT